MSFTAIIGGTGLTELSNLDNTHKEMVNTPYGLPSGPLTFGKVAGNDVVFLARHGYHHTIPPHKVNYRANCWALKEVGVKRIIAVAAVGGITQTMWAALRATRASMMQSSIVTSGTWSKALSAIRHPRDSVARTSNTPASSPGSHLMVMADA